MRRVILYSFLLIAGIIGSQTLPMAVAGWDTYAETLVRWLMMSGLAFIMIHVGFEFDIDKKNPKRYAWDYVVAATAAGFPWLFCCLYFVFAMTDPAGWSVWPVWKESLLASRFASPTSAGVLFSMLAAAGLGATWLYGKARILAIFDDLDTVLLLIPLQVAIVGFRWQVVVIIAVLLAMLWAAWWKLHAVRLPLTWPWVLLYSAGLVGLTEGVYYAGKAVDPTFPMHIEVLLPAFVIGCMLARPVTAAGEPAHDPLETPTEERAAAIIAGIFMFCVGLSIPVFRSSTAVGAGEESYTAEFAESVDWPVIALHVLVITLLSNLGKMFPALCYRREAPRRERLALAIALWPRGEVGAGVLVLSISYGIGGPIMIVAILSLALNLVLTGVFIAFIKSLLARSPEPYPEMEYAHPTAPG